MFDSLGFKLQETIQKLRGQKQITEDNIDSSLNEIRRQLLEADVSLKAVKLFTNRVKEQAIGSEVLTGVKPGEQLVKIIYEALEEVLGAGIADADKLNLQQLQKFLLRLQCKLFEVGTNSSQLINAVRFSIDRDVPEAVAFLLDECDIFSELLVFRLKFRPLRCIDFHLL